MFSKEQAIPHVFCVSLVTCVSVWERCLCIFIGKCGDMALRRALSYLLSLVILSAMITTSLFGVFRGILALALAFGLAIGLEQGCVE